MPVAERSAAPDRLLEVVSAHRVPVSWYRSRVAPRLSQRGLVRVFYGQPGIGGSVFEAMEAEALADEAVSGQRRRFSLVSR
jgi:hypothetical protein